MGDMLEQLYEAALDDKDHDLRHQVARVLVEEHVETRHVRGDGKRPCINVKVHGSLTDEQLEDVRSELPERFRAGFTHEYLEDADPDGTWWNAAGEWVWENAREEAEQIFGRGVKVNSYGRSGGWLVVSGLPDTEESPDEWTGPAYGRWPKEILGWKIGELETKAEDSLLDRWRFYCALAEANVEDFPRAVAWQIAMNKYLPECEEREKAEAAESERRQLASGLR